jgi:hypothetical protein
MLSGTDSWKKPFGSETHTMHGLRAAITAGVFACGRLAKQDRIINPSMNAMRQQLGNVA